MEKDIFEGAIYEELANTLAKAHELEVGSAEHAKAIQDIKELSMIQLENEKAAEDIRIKEETLKAEKKKNWIDVGKNVFLAGMYTATGFVMMKYNLREGSLQGKDGMKFFDQIKTILKH